MHLSVKRSVVLLLLQDTSPAHDEQLQHREEVQLVQTVSSLCESSLLDDLYWTTCIELSYLLKNNHSTIAAFNSINQEKCISDEVSQFCITDCLSVWCKVCIIPDQFYHYFEQWRKEEERGRIFGMSWWRRRKMQETNVRSVVSPTTTNCNIFSKCVQHSQNHVYWLIV